MILPVELLLVPQLQASSHFWSRLSLHPSHPKRASEANYAFGSEYAPSMGVNYPGSLGILECIKADASRHHFQHGPLQHHTALRYPTPKLQYSRTVSTMSSAATSWCRDVRPIHLCYTLTISKQSTAAYQLGHSFNDARKRISWAA